MSLFVFNNQQKLIKSIPNRDLISVVQDQAINVSDTLFVEMPADIWSNLKEPASYLAVQDPYERFSYHMYKVSKHTTKADTTDIEAIQIGYDELKAYGYIKDRRFNNRPVLEAATAVVSGTDWQLGYVDTDLPNVNTNFYYISRLEALSKLIEATGAEVRFRVEISGNKIIAKRLDLYKQLGTFKGKRFAYGSNLLEIIKEEDTSELYTALVGRGKGEETDTGGFGRRITFADIAWSKASGKPVDKPLGQEFIELPEMTAYYGYPDGEPRTGIVEFGDIEEPEQLLEATYERLVEISRPQVQFKAKVQTTGDMQLGEEVAIIRSDLGFRYKTRVFRVKRDYLNNMFTEVELGDKLTESLASRIKKIDTTNARREETIIQYIQTAANGKNKIFRGLIEPTEGMMVNDLWYKPVGEGETMLYTWNGEIWELSKVSAGLLAGTLDAENGDVNLINVNVANIVGDTSEFIKSNWNAMNNSVEIIGNGIRSTNLENSIKTYIDSGRIVFGDDTAQNVGGMATSELLYENERYKGIGIFVEADKFFSIGKKWSGTDASYTPMLRSSIIEPGLDIMVNTTFRANVNMNDKEIHNTHAIYLGNGLKGLTDSVSNIPAFTGSQGVYLAYGTPNDWSQRLLAGDTMVRVFRQLDLNGNEIINQSDIRLKTNVTDGRVDALAEIERMKFIEFEWDKTNPANEGKPDGRHFGIVAQYSPFLQTKAGDSESYLSVDMSKQVNLNSKAIQELKKENDTLKQELADLKAILSEKGLI